ASVASVERMASPNSCIKDTCRDSVMRSSFPRGRACARSKKRGCFLVVQTLWAEKFQSTTDAGSLNTFGRNEIEVAPISSALLRIACLVILYKTPYSGPRTGSRWGYQAVWGLALDYLSKMKIAIVVGTLVISCAAVVWFASSAFTAFVSGAVCRASWISAITV